MAVTKHFKKVPKSAQNATKRPKVPKYFKSTQIASTFCTQCRKSNLTENVSALIMCFSLFSLNQRQLQHQHRCQWQHQRQHHWQQRWQWQHQRQQHWQHQRQHQRQQQHQHQRQCQWKHKCGVIISSASTKDRYYDNRETFKPSF